MTQELLIEAEKKMEASLAVFRQELTTFHTGRANPALITHIKVDFMGMPQQLSHIASVSASGADMLVIQPWMPNSLSAIEKAILKANVGLTPSSDGTVIRLKIPPLSSERREELIKLVRRREEDTKIAIRNVRRDAADKLKQMEKDKETSQDECRMALTRLQQLTDGVVAMVEKERENKETELREV
ncbi:MAG: ribosome recycling factor [Dehalococcoidales bacterium]|jgi:ribosome recycling factor|nr:ribosome recycling factor [Dehalococcoidales bacterium]MDD3265352.1 ribosome recycling factor [Dehalococcoidales bacterium]MDD4322834.1 ribosome recycling factor [Dehalococcoidales bacterium]MDD4794549.1 ribosome recycling factor [Dehalococcoidales bacterium]MDD5122398.1 ribosome recycling factor [Dehalococcoidales bacterium]